METLAHISLLLVVQTLYPHAPTLTVLGMRQTVEIDKQCMLHCTPYPLLSLAITQALFRQNAYTIERAIVLICHIKQAVL
ncbi:MAG: hypothetical protein NVS4B11_15530 [Ktedonobacteraceae bacterium]